MSLPPLRPYQADVLERASEASASSSGILIVQPTGTGKTRVAVEACARHVERGGSPIFVAPRRELVTQARTALEARGIVRPVVWTIQSLLSGSPPRAALVVLDEARHYVADEWRRLRELFPDALFLGLDATPERGDGRGLGTAHGGLFDVLLEAITIKDAVAGGFLVPCDTIRPDHALEPGQLAQDPVDAYMQYAHGTSAVLFAGSVALAYEYAARLRDLGVRAAGVDGAMPIGERDACLDAYNRGELKVLCNVALLTEGWDAPRTETVILAGPCGTVGGLLQRAGRGMRLYDGKKEMKLLDLRGVTHTFGDVDEPRTWHLEGKAARRAGDDIDVRFCPCCGSPVVGKECEVCGHAGEMRHRPPKVLGLPIQRFARIRAEDDEAKARRLANWLKEARRRGFREGQAYHRYRGAMGDFPSPAIKSRARALAND